MSTTTIDFRTLSVARTAAHRAADGVVAAYIHALANSVEPADAEPADQRSRFYEAAAAPLGGGFARACASGRSSRPTRAGAVSIRRRPARRRALLQA